jgi:hypothetical protein
MEERRNGKIREYKENRNLDLAYNNPVKKKYKRHYREKLVYKFVLYIKLFEIVIKLGLVD